MFRKRSKKPVSLDSATFWFDVSNVVLLLGAALVVIGTYGVYKTGAIKERYSDERLSENEKETRRATADSDIAKAEAAKANARAIEAQLQLEKFRSPRVITDEQRVAIVGALSKWALIGDGGQRQSLAVFPIDPSFEAASLADQLATVFGADGVGFSINRNAVMYGKTYSLSGVGLLTSRNPRGITVAAAIAETLNAAGIQAFVLSDRRKGCEDMEQYKGDAETDPWCSAISLMVGEHPR